MAEPAQDLIPYFTVCNEETVSMSNRVDDVHSMCLYEFIEI